MYGAGTLSMALGFNNLDSIAFLIQFNDGYAMTIKDMAAAFYVVDETKQVMAETRSPRSHVTTFMQLPQVRMVQYLSLHRTSVTIEFKLNR